MGGIGSGRRWSNKETTSDYSTLDVRQWHRAGLVAVGRSFAHGVWNVDVITAMKRGEPNMLCLHRTDDKNAHREAVRIWIEWTPCNYGGKRPWLLCPEGCGNRVALLYYGYYGDGPSCRYCRQLIYETQQETRKNRAMHRAQSIRMQLGGSGSLRDPFPDKPKGMHFRTYLQLFSKAMSHEQAFWGPMVELLNRLGGRSGS